MVYIQNFLHRSAKCIVIYMIYVSLVSSKHNFIDQLYHIEE